MTSITAEEVCAEVKKFWEYFSRKSKNRFDEMYLPSATVFAADSRRMEPARLMLVRRERELFAAGSQVSAKLGTIDVQMAGRKLAVASYPFHFSITRTLASGKRVRVEMPWGRATQVLQRDENGVLRIVHEHMSSAEPVAPKELPAADQPPASRPT